MIPEESLRNITEHQVRMRGTCIIALVSRGQTLLSLRERVESGHARLSLHVMRAFNDVMFHYRLQEHRKRECQVSVELPYGL